MSKRKRCAAKVVRGDLLGVFGTGRVFSVRCPKLAAPGRRICRTHVAMKETRRRHVHDEATREQTRRRRERRRRDKKARAHAHVTLRRRQKAARRARKAKEPGTKPGSAFLPTSRKKGKRYGNDNARRNQRQAFFSCVNHLRMLAHEKNAA